MGPLGPESLPGAGSRVPSTTEAGARQHMEKGLMHVVVLGVEGVLVAGELQ